MDYWDQHGWLFLFGLALFPRTTLLFFSTTPFGWLAWVGWLVAPSLLVAILSIAYWDKNPILCIIAWVIFLGKLGGTGRTARRAD